YSRPDSRKIMKPDFHIDGLALVLLAFAPPSVQAQTAPTNATTNSQLANSNTANALGVTTGTPTTTQQQTSNRSPTPGVICIEEMTATFCNVPSGPNTNGYGSPGGSGDGGTGSSGGGGVAAAAAPPAGGRCGTACRVCVGRRRGCQHDIHPGLRRFSDGQ